MTLLVVLASALGWLGLGWISFVALLVVPVHFYLQLKGAYGLSVAGALLRTIALTAFATVALGLFGLLMLLVGVL
jgi:hypothetical protein